MKHMKLFEHYLTVEETMDHLSMVAKRIVQNLPTLTREQGAELALEDNFRIVVKRLSTSQNIITFMEVEVYFDDKHIGNINIDFKSEAPHILVAYNLDSLSQELRKP
jgi:hypothetical protein